MDATETERAEQAAMSVATALGLTVDEAVVLNNSNRLITLLLPCTTVARVSPAGWFSATREVEVAHRLAIEGDAPVAGLDPRVEPRAITRDGFEISLWTYVEPAPPRALPPGDYAHTLERLHRAMGRIDIGAPHCSDRIAQIRRWLDDDDVTPELSGADRQLIVQRLETPRRRRSVSTPAEQLLHGEPHPWNLLAAENGLLFIDFENCARGPVEYDLAWVPTAVSERYPGADQAVVGDYRGVVLALVAAHRWRRDDRHPSGVESGVAFLDVLRAGPPWPALDDVHW